MYISREREGERAGERERTRGDIGTHCYVHIRRERKRMQGRAIDIYLSIKRYVSRGESARDLYSEIERDQERGTSGPTRERELEKDISIKRERGNEREREREIERYIES